MPILIPEFTEEARLSIVEKGRQSLYFFMTGILGLDLLDPVTKKSSLTSLHYDLCSFLEGRHPHHPWNFALVCAWRGMGKSVPSTQVYPVWRSLYIDGFSAKLISNSSDNMRVNHFEKIRNVWRNSERADYLQWLYEDRIPKGFEGWNSDQIVFKSSNPQSPPSLTYWGLESKFEGWHGDLVVLDDPEGADADKSLAANTESWRAVQRCIPLLSEPAKGQILIVATPHGRKPLVYKIRDMQDWKTEADNAHSDYKIWWREVLDERGLSRWPERFPDSYLNMLRKSDVWSQQYMLLRTASTTSLFDQAQITKSLYNWQAGGPKEGTKLIHYPAFEFDPEKVNSEGFVIPEPTWNTVTLQSLRYYIHFDPLHRETSARRTHMTGQRPAYPAIAVVGIAPDSHAFLVDYWLGRSVEADLPRQAMELFRLYRLWSPYLVTWESIGAQVWLKAFIQTMERQNPEWNSPKSSGALWPSGPLPRLSTRLQEGEKMNQGKEQIYREILSPWLNMGVLHLRQDQTDMLHQLSNAQNDNEAVDLLDAVAQGPEVWKPPLYEGAERKMNARRRFVDAMVGGVKEKWKQRTGYRKLVG